MADQVVVRGTVVGEAGVAVAGWVSLGKKLPLRWLSHSLRITSDEGHEITLDGLGADTIAPVTKREVAWSAIEGEELAKLCTREAPAPDVEVDFTTAVLRGGDAIVAWGEVTDRGYVGGDSQRGSVEGGITKLRADVIAVGDERESLLERGRKRHLERAEKAAAKRGVTATTQPEGAKSATEPGLRVVTVWHLLAFAGVIVMAALAALTGEVSRFVLCISSFAWLPRMLDGQLIPRMRQGRLAPGGDLDIPFVVYLLAAGVVVFAAFSVTFGKPGKVDNVTIASFVFAGAAALMVLWMTLLTRERRRYLSIVAKAPPHPDPIKDSVWGASVGRFSSEVLLIGAEYTATGSGKNVTVRESKFANLTPQAPMTREASSVDVQLGDAAILTLAKYTESTGERAEKRAEIIASTTPVIAVGRATDGVLRKGGEASLIVFASAAGTEVLVELRKLRTREHIADVMALLGVASVVAAFLL